MAKGKEDKVQPTKKYGGPYVAAAVFCQTVMGDPEGRMTPTNIFDTLGVLVPSFVHPSKKEPIRLQLYAFVSFRSGDASGDHSFYIEVESPSGKRQKKEERKITLTEGAQGGFNISLKIDLAVVKGGLFWSDVFIDDKLMTRMPLFINVTRDSKPTAKNNEQPLPKK
jgi:hypothetical protein